MTDPEARTGALNWFTDGEGLPHLTLNGRTVDDAATVTLAASVIARLALTAANTAAQAGIAAGKQAEHAVAAQATFDLLARPRRRTIERDEVGRITSVVDELA